LAPSAISAFCSTTGSGGRHASSRSRDSGLLARGISGAVRRPTRNHLIIAASCRLSGRRVSYPHFLAATQRVARVHPSLGPRFT
jgi:hypothetical protein